MVHTTLNSTVKLMLQFSVSLPSSNLTVNAILHKDMEGTMAALYVSTDNLVSVASLLGSEP